MPKKTTVIGLVVPLTVLYFSFRYSYQNLGLNTKVPKATMNKPSSSKNATLTEVQSQFITSKQLPIYLLTPSNKTVYLTNWGSLSSSWDRTSEYQDFIHDAHPTPSLPTIHRQQKRPVVVFHCGPKTGSTTLRVACKNNLERRCGLYSDKVIDPEGYTNTTEFYQLVRTCPKTFHFCAKNITMPMDIPLFQRVHFLHMFPFRNYNDWAISAMKQSYDRWKEEGCARLNTSFVEKNCRHYRWELDFRKYAKTDLAMYKEFILERMNGLNESHSFVLYHHRELEDVLGVLSEVYRIPGLEGSHKHYKGSRPEGTCEEEILDKFHECFSGELMKLT